MESVPNLPVHEFPIPRLRTQHDNGHTGPVNRIPTHLIKVLNVVTLGGRLGRAMAMMWCLKSRGRVKKPFIRMLNLKNMIIPILRLPNMHNKNE